MATINPLQDLRSAVSTAAAVIRGSAGEPPVQPRLERRNGVEVVRIPAEAGYGLDEAPASVLA